MGAQIGEHANGAKGLVRYLVINVLHGLRNRSLLVNSDRLWPIGIDCSLLASAWFLQELTCLLSAVEVIMTFHGVISLLSWRESCQSEPSRFFEIVILDRNEVVSRHRQGSRMIANVQNLAPLIMLGRLHVHLQYIVGTFRFTIVNLPRTAYREVR